MDCARVIRHRPSEVLAQVASSMHWLDGNHTVELPAFTTYHIAIRAVEAATTDIERSFPLSTLTREQAIARQSVSSASSTRKLQSYGPIRTSLLLAFWCGLIAGVLIISWFEK